MTNVAVGLLLGILIGLLLRPALDAYVLWRAARQMNEDAERTDFEAAPRDDR